MKLRIPFITKFFGGSYMGAILDTYSKAAAVIGGIQFFMMTIILYTTSAAPYIQQYAPWLSFPLYLILAFAGTLVLMVISRWLITPSSYTFFNSQVWGCNNPMRDKLEEIEKKVDVLNQDRAIIEENQRKIMKKLGIED